MFSEGHLLYFDPFKFHNGTQKPKFFVVLKHDGNGLLLASLPTSKDQNTYPVAEFEEQSRLGEMKIILKGKMEAGLFDDLRDCLKKSACVKNKFKRIL